MEPCSWATHCQCSEMVLELWQLLCEERSRIWGQKSHALQTTYPNPEFLRDAIREKDKLANFLSTSCISLQPSFLLMPSWFFLHIPPSATCSLTPPPSACLATLSSAGARSWETWPNKLHGSCGWRGNLGMICTCLFNPPCCLFLTLRCSMCSTDWIPNSLKGKWLKFVSIS